MRSIKDVTTVLFPSYLSVSVGSYPQTRVEERFRQSTARFNLKFPIFRSGGRIQGLVLRPVAA